MLYLVLIAMGAWLAWLTFSHMSMKDAIAETKAAIEDAIGKVRRL